MCEISWSQTFLDELLQAPRKEKMSNGYKIQYDSRKYQACDHKLCDQGDCPVEEAVGDKRELID